MTDGNTDALRDEVDALTGKLEVADKVRDYDRRQADHLSTVVDRLNAAAIASADKLAEVTAHNAYLEAALATYTEQNRPTKGSLKRQLAIKAILSERRRQIEVEGWTPEHDDLHNDGSLALVAALYATPQPLYTVEMNINEEGQADFFGFDDPWPSEWDSDWDKRLVHSQRKKLVIAGALILAEIERLDRTATEAGQ